MTFRSPDEIILEALRKEVRELLERCTEEQRAVFARAFPIDIDDMSVRHLRNAIPLCQRTIIWNDAKQQLKIWSRP